MKLATLDNGSRDGALIVVSKDLTRACRADHIAATLQSALDNWSLCLPALKQLAADLEAHSVAAAFDFDASKVMAPLPRAYQWIDGSVYRNHFRLMQAAFDASTTVRFTEHDPLVYQGGSDGFLGARSDIELPDEEDGIDFEAEIAVVVDDVPMGTDPQQALELIRLVVLVNDVSLRNLIPAELNKGFGFFVAKPASAFSPVAVTPDELGEHWHGGLLHLPIHVEWNGKEVGRPDAGEGAAFTFPQLIAHAASRRDLCAGTIIGLGTASNSDSATGAACIAEIRASERLAHGHVQSSYMRFGDRVSLEVRSPSGESVFGKIDQMVARRDKR